MIHKKLWNFLTDGGSGNTLAQGRLPAELEREFDADFLERNLMPRRQAVFGLLITILIFGAIDINAPAETRMIGISAHYLFLCPALVLALAIMPLQSFRRRSQSIMIFVAWCFAGTYMFLEHAVPTTPGSDASVTTVALILFVLVGAGIFRLRLIYYVGYCVSVVVAYAALIAFAVLRIPNAVWNVCILATAAILGSIVALVFERNARTEFLLRRTLEAERKKLAEQNVQLASQNYHLDGLAEARFEAARDAAHEISNRLDAIGKPIETAKRRLGVETAPILSYLDDADNRLDELKVMLTTSLNIPRMAAGHPAKLEAPKWAVLDEIVREISDRKSGELLLSREVESEGKTYPDLQTELNTGAQPVRLYPYSLRQVLDNILGNAVKYSPNGGTIILRTWATPDDLLISVTDPGIGIAAARLESLFFSAYERGDADRLGIAGSGIGLRIIYKLVEAQGGRIWAESAGIGRGSAFTVAIPRHLKAETNTSSESAARSQEIVTFASERH